MPPPGMTGHLEELLEKLIGTIERNNQVTNKLDQSLVKYTRWLVGLTVTVIVIMLIQIIIMICR